MTRSMLRLVLLVVTCAGLTGCHLDGTSFRMNSDSNIPFFGFSLSDSGQRPRPSQFAEGEITPVVLKDSTESPRPPKKNPIRQWLDSMPRVRIPIPRTDTNLDESIAATQSTSERLEL